ncbi:mechanosensitive ion channel family protein [Oceanomicrobium pacificus]|uniref:Mechanosensitive ion channel n=1 Tax=Oceanomicrobium pacificus TaxID=2692916 RepID=A0A6B0TL06_9RHOB|nr:mechanosensitive ion channel family protein [Oceanomicrobium pacificus]MXU65177.1 mechanosensitive ion channel [Oceanomicrobium pacificus]
MSAAWRAARLFSARFALLLCIGAGAGDAQVTDDPLEPTITHENSFPLAPPDRSSPAATLDAFLSHSAAGNAALRNGDPPDTVIGHFSRADATIDPGAVAASDARIARTEAALLLYEILVRAGLPPRDRIPGGDGTEDLPESWRIPQTEFAIQRQPEGPLTGEYLIGPLPLAEMRRAYERVAHLPVPAGVEPGSYRIYQTRPNLTSGLDWMPVLPEGLTRPVAQNALWKWLALGAALLAVAAGLWLVWRILARFAGRGVVVGLLLSLAVALAALWLDRFMTDVIGLRFTARSLLSHLFLGVAFLALVGIAVFALEWLAIALAANPLVRRRGVSPHLLRLVMRVLSLTVAIFIIVEATDYLGLNIAPVIAGLGVGGLAMALAARPTLENMIGGFILFADRPVAIGEFCRFGGETGTVEDIGLRSTRVRRLDDRVVTIPNANFSQMEIMNDTRIHRRLYNARLGLRFETTSAQIESLTAALDAMLRGHERVLEDRLHTAFETFGDHALVVEIFAYIDAIDWLDFKAVRADLNLRVLAGVGRAGSAFAFPTRTVHLGRDSGMPEPDGTGSGGRSAEA